MAVESAEFAKQIAFLPWLRLSTAHSVGGVSFVPFVDADGNVSNELQDAADFIRPIVSGYVDRDGQPITNCVVAVLPDKGWDLADEDFETIRSAAALLFLGAWAANEYFPRFFGSYVNASSLRLVWQRFTGTPVWISLTSRRRDGRTVNGGYRHGEIKFSVPLQCSLREVAKVDRALLEALNVCKDSATLRRLQGAMPFVLLANSDDDLMAEPAEAILMGSAFEQLLRGDASAFKLGRKFGSWFSRFGSVTVETARHTRPGIEIDTSDPARAAAQPGWWVHRKWMEELYDLRSRSVHRGTHTGRTWGWSPNEHLLMAALVFPLAVKLLLESEGCYSLTEDDIGRCLAVDKLLSVAGWDEEPDNGPHRWNSIVTETVRHHKFEAIAKRFGERWRAAQNQDSSANDQGETQ